MMIRIADVVRVPRRIVPTMEMNNTDYAVMKVRRPSQCHGGLWHDAGGCRCFRNNDDGALVHESDRRQQHETAGEPTQAGTQARFHAVCLGHAGLENKNDSGASITRTPMGMTKAITRNVINFFPVQPATTMNMEVVKNSDQRGREKDLDHSHLETKHGEHS